MGVKLGFGGNCGWPSSLTSNVPSFAQYKAEYEEKIAIAEAHIGKALEDREKVTAVHNTLLAQKNELVLALQSGGSAVQEIIDKTVRVEAMAADVQKQVDEVNARIKGEKEEKNLIGQAQTKVNAQKGAWEKKSKLWRAVSVPLTLTGLKKMTKS